MPDNPNNKLPEPEQFQTVIIELSNGDTGAFTGKPFTNATENDLHITDIKFLPPRPLPDGCVFEQIEDEEEFNSENLPEVTAGDGEVTEPENFDQEVE